MPTVEMLLQITLLSFPEVGPQALEHLAHDLEEFGLATHGAAPARLAAAIL